MKLETGNWKIAVLAAAWIGGCLVFAAIGFVGCSTVAPLIPEPGAGELPAAGMNSGEYMEWCLANGIDVVTGKKIPQSQPEVTEALKAADIASCHQGAGDEWLRWPATHPLKATIKGNRLHLESTAFKAWPSKDDIVGAMWFVVLRDSKWQAYCWDYTRARNDPREVPWRTATKVSWMTVVPGERWFVCMTGLYRDKRRTVSERTVIAEVEQ